MPPLTVKQLVLLLKMPLLTKKALSDDYLRSDSVSWRLAL